jgi:hypothetical protein
LIGDILVVGVSVLHVELAILVDVDDGCWSWLRSPWSSTDGLLVDCMWSSSLSGEPGEALAGGRGWS